MPIRESSRRRVSTTANALELGQIGPDDVDRDAMVRAQAGRERLQSRLVAGHQHQVVATTCEAVSVGGTDTGGSAGNEDCGASAHKVALFKTGRSSWNAVSTERQRLRPLERRAARGRESRLVGDSRSAAAVKRRPDRTPPTALRFSAVPQGRGWRKKGRRQLVKPPASMMTIVIYRVKRFIMIIMYI